MRRVHPVVVVVLLLLVLASDTFAEGVATLGLLIVIFGVVRSGRSAMAAVAVSGYIAGAYWFTSSTSFANPAVTIGRAFTDTFAGIAPASLPGFIVAQLVGLLVGSLSDFWTQELVRAVQRELYGAARSTLDLQRIEAGAERHEEIIVEAGTDLPGEHARRDGAQLDRHLSPPAPRADADGLRTDAPVPARGGSRTRAAACSS